MYPGDKKFVMPPVSRPVQYGAEPTAFEKMKMGAIMGVTSGSIIGVLYGTVAIYQYGPGAAGYMRTMGKYMANSAATFGLLMTVGSVIRSEGVNPESWHAQMRREGITVPVHTK